MSILGLDIGTTNCKGAVFSADGKCLFRAARELIILRPRPGWVELDSKAIVSAVFEIIRELALSAREAGDPVRALSASALGEAMTPISSDRQILGNAIHYTDTRGRSEIDAFMTQISQEALYEINPNIVSTAYSLVKLLWLRRNHPEIYRNADKFLFFGDLIFSLLGCEATTSFSQANRTLLFDLRKEAWSDQLLKIAGFDVRKLPRLVPSGHIAGTVDVEKAAALGLERDVICVVGGHDQCCNALGVGICSAGKAVDGIGTVECITPVYAGIPDTSLMLQARLNIEHHVVPGLYVSFLYNQAGSLVKWFRNTFAGGEQGTANEDLYAHLTAEMPVEPTRLLVLPHFEPTGAPSFIEDSSGVILGLRTSTRRGEILKAIMEGETFYFLECLKSLASLGVDTSRFVASGGGAKSAAWLQIKADIIGAPVERTGELEAGVLGAAMIAAKALGVFVTYEEAIDRFVHSGQIFEPDINRHAIYREQFERYRQLYPRLVDVLKPMAVSCLPAQRQD